MKVRYSVSVGGKPKRTQWYDVRDDLDFDDWDLMTPDDKWELAQDWAEQFIVIAFEEKE